MSQFDAFRFDGKRVLVVGGASGMGAAAASLALDAGAEVVVMDFAPIALDGVQRSTRYPGGVALRFARVVRYRHDKDAADADTISTVRAVSTR